MCARDHAARAGATNRGEGLAAYRPISAARSARDRVIAGVLFTCSRSDSGRDRDVSARGEHGRYVMASWRAPRASYRSAPLPSFSPPLPLLCSNVVYADFALAGPRLSFPLRSHTANGLVPSRARVCRSLLVLRGETHFSLSLFTLVLL